MRATERASAAGKAVRYQLYEARRSRVQATRVQAQVVWSLVQGALVTLAR